MEFIDRLDIALQDKDMTAKELTESLGVGKTTVNDWRRGKSTPSPKALIGISHILDVSIDWLLTGSDKPRAPYGTSDLIYSVEEQLLLSYYRNMSGEHRLELQKRAAKMATRSDWVIAGAVRGNLLKRVEHVKTKVKMKVYTESAAAGIGNYLNDNPTYDVIRFDMDEVPSSADFGVRISGDSMMPEIEDGQIVWVEERAAIDDGDIGIFILDGESYCKQLLLDHRKRRMTLVSLNERYKPIVIEEHNNLRTIGKVLM